MLVAADRVAEGETEMEAGADKGGMLARIQSGLGALPLSVMLLLVLWMAGAAVGGREAFSERFAAFGGRAGGTLLVVVAGGALLAHAVLGARLVLREMNGAGPYVSVGSRWLQRGSAVAILLFAIAVTVRVGDAVWAGADAAALYDVLRRDLGKPMWLLVHVVGLSVTCFHAGHGLAAAAIRCNWVSGHRSSRLARGVGLALSFLIWFYGLNTLAYLATGSRLI